MAINGKKISALGSLSNLTGNEYLLVSYKGKSYRIPTSFLIGNVLTGITQEINDGDGEDNPITITSSNGTTQVFHVYNGQTGAKGPTGDTGEQGPKGEDGIIIPDDGTFQSIQQKILHHLSEFSNWSEEQLVEKILSAAAGKELAEKVDKLKEVYLDSEDQYEQLLASDEVDNDTKYFIFEE